MALDESNEKDETFKVDGLTFMIEKELFEMVKPVKIDFIETSRGSGYMIESNLKKGEGCGGCAGSCG
ncbi:MAG TPA: hypothetical protein P5551_02150 [Syntrophales bacterium]|jgi:Fe-S cluster assembly iron-binding protein IscA|nr:hypothetical protein [Syntrophales bacterium]HRT61151.1 hypothetical protein [Syntrophales bacterium]